MVSVASGIDSLSFSFILLFLLFLPFSFRFCHLASQRFAFQRDYRASVSFAFVVVVDYQGAYSLEGFAFLIVNGAGGYSHWYK